MARSLQVVICALLLCTHSALCLWDFAVTSKTKILFYDNHWQEITSAAHQFDQLSALTFDETEEIIYFNDQLHNNGSIFSLKIPTAHEEEDQQIVEKIVQRTQNESISSIAYDPLYRKLFWADSHNRKIFYMSIVADVTSQPKVLIDFTEEESIPDGLAIDICRRKLYWTNSNFKNASVERIDLEGNGREVIIRSDLYLPHGIVVDQFSDRIYYVVDQQGVHFSVESSNLDGSDRRVIVKGLNNVPFNLAVTNDAIFWTDLTHNAIWSHSKFPIAKVNPTDNEGIEGIEGVSHKVLSFAEQPRGIVTRTGFLTNLQNDKHCSDVVTAIKTRLLKPKPTRNPIEGQILKLRRNYCLNGGEFIEKSGLCACKSGFKGARCEIDECFNYCVHGTCFMSSMGFPDCTCQRGFYGAKCQSYKCAGYCLNDGICKIDTNDEPTCECRDNFGGQRCEHNSTEICSLFCRILKHDPDTEVPFGCRDICEELVEQHEDGLDIYAIPKYKHLESESGSKAEKCQLDKCAEYCLNDGLCKIDTNGEPTCECRDNYGGNRCEHNSTEICSLLCRLQKLDPDTKVPFGCRDICKELAEQREDGLDIYTIPKYQHLESCKNMVTWSSTVIIVLVCGVVSSLILAVLLVHGLRRFYKPARPRIKKTFVVRKQTSASSDTPLTNRPMATEQCEITIENCCNMNICDTPCFDPKLVQQSLSRDNHVKEDKKMLINNMEDELY